MGLLSTDSGSFLEQGRLGVKGVDSHRFSFGSDTRPTTVRQRGGKKEVYTMWTGRSLGGDFSHGPKTGLG